MGKLEDKKQALQGKIVSETARLIADKGYELVTMEGVAKSCGITKRTLYKYFPVKEAIVAQYIQNTLSSMHQDRIDKMAKMDSFEAMTAYYLQGLMEGVMRQPLMFEYYLKYLMGNLVVSQMHASPKSHVEDPLAFILKRGYEEEKINEALPYKLIKDLFLFTFVELTKNYYEAPEQFQLEDHLNVCMMIFVNGVRRA